MRIDGTRTTESSSLVKIDDSAVETRLEYTREHMSVICAFASGGMSKLIPGVHF